MHKYELVLVGRDGYDGSHSTWLTEPEHDEDDLHDPDIPLLHAEPRQCHGHLHHCQEAHGYAYLVGEVSNHSDDEEPHDLPQSVVPKRCEDLPPQVLHRRRLVVLHHAVEVEQDAHLDEGEHEDGW